MGNPGRCFSLTLLHLMIHPSMHASASDSLAAFCMKGSHVVIDGGFFDIDGEGSRHPRHGVQGDCLCALCGGSTECAKVTMEMSRHDHTTNSVFTFVRDHDNGFSHRGGSVQATECHFKTSCRTIVGAIAWHESDPGMECNLQSCNLGQSRPVSEELGRMGNVQVQVTESFCVLV